MQRTRIQLLFLSICCLGAMYGQTTNGLISGRVTDSTSAVVPGAHVRLLNDSISYAQSVEADSNGEFVFPSVLPGSYRVSVEKQGFEKYEKTGIELTATQRLSLGTISLTIGSVKDTVTVAAEVTPLQTTSSETSSTVTGDQLENQVARGRDFLSLMRMLPGSTYEGYGNDTLNSSSAGNINGVRNSYMSINIDGIAANTRNIGTTEDTVNMDAIAEVKVLQNNYQAEYGKVAGAVIDVVTKSGTNQYHGSAYEYFRNEDLNANTFFNNLNGKPRSRYRYNTIGYNAGGPVPLKPVKNKLFFFFSQEIQPVTAPNALRTYTVPTAIERQGDFSQSINSSGALYVVKNPLTGVPYSGNVVPGSQLNPVMEKLLNIFPQPNFANRAVSKGNYNFIVADSNNEPARQEVLRVDYLPTEKWRIYFRGNDLHDTNTGHTTAAGISAGWQDGTLSYDTRGPNVGLNITYTVTPNIVNELAVGAGFWYETNAYPVSTLNEFSKTALGINLGQLYPQNNPLNVIQGMSFGTIPNPAQVSYDPRFPMDDTVLQPSLSDGISVVRGAHVMKFGIYTDIGQYIQNNHAGTTSGFAGTFTFTGANTSNPFNTGYPYAEALLGYFDSYTEATARPNYWGLTKTLEWYGQDSWKVTKRLTLDYGLRFTGDIPASLKNGQGATLFFNQYSPAQVPPLFQPVKVNGTREMLDPVNGQLYPAVYYGAFVPGVGNTAPGSLAATATNFPGFFKSRGVVVAPRFGFAYDVFGNGKTAIRGGFGIFVNQRVYQGQIGNATFNPPTIEYPIEYYGNVSTFLNATGVTTPSNINTVFERSSHLPSNYNLNFDIQQNIGHQMVLDVAYVGVLARHITDTRQLNEVPYGAEFLPQNQDPTTNTPLTDNYFRPYPGYGNIPYTEFASSSNYHSLQAQVNRRFAHGLQMGAAFTWSKVLDYSNNGGTIPTYLSPTLLYGPASIDRKFRLVANWVWDIPNASRVWSNWATRQILDHWQLSGIATFSTGAPNTVSYTTTNGVNITGGGDGAKIVVNGNPTLSRDQRGYARYFNTSVFSEPAVGTIGNAWTPLFYGPGINDWDIALFKKIPIEKVNFQIRWETYNTFNHTQYSAVNTAAQFNATGVQVNAAFGQVTAARDPRIMQIAARFTF
jgi:hypothetical protein